MVVFNWYLQLSSGCAPCLPTPPPTLILTPAKTLVCFKSVPSQPLPHVDSPLLRCSFVWSRISPTRTSDIQQLWSSFLPFAMLIPLCAAESSSVVWGYKSLQASNSCLLFYKTVTNTPNSVGTCFRGSQIIMSILSGTTRNRHLAPC